MTNDFISQIKLGGTFQQISTLIEAELYQKSGLMLEQVQLREAAQLFEDEWHTQNYKGWMSPNGTPHIFKYTGEHAGDHHPEIADKIKKSGKYGTTESIKNAQKLGYTRFGHSGENEYTYIHYDKNAPGGKESASHTLKFIKPSKMGLILVNHTPGLGSKDGKELNPSQAAAHIKEELIMEADPTPRIWNDEKGNPIVPSSQDWAQHYQGLAASHVKAQVDAAKERWKEASQNTASDKHAAAELKNLKINIAVGERILKQKTSVANKIQKVQKKKLDTHKKHLYKTFSKVLHPFVGGSPMWGHILHHATDAAAGYLDKNKGSNTQKS